MALKGSFTLDTKGGVGNDQVYDTVTSTWVGGGANSADFTSGYLLSNSVTSRCYIPGSFLEKNPSFNDITIVFDYQVNAVDNALDILYYIANGDFLRYRHDSFGSSDVALQMNYGSNPEIWWSPEPSLSTWHNIELNINFVAQTLTVKVDGNLQTPTSQNLTAIADWGTMSDNFYLGYVESGTNSIFLKNLKIYDGPATGSGPTNKTHMWWGFWK